MSATPAQGLTPAPALTSVAVLGAGSWGTALAIQFARGADSTTLWGRDRAQMDELARDRRNSRYLSDARFPDHLKIESDLARVIAGHRDLIIAVPSHSLRGMLVEIAAHRRPDMRLAWATKGFELS